MGLQLNDIHRRLHGVVTGVLRRIILEAISSLVIQGLLDMVTNLVHLGIDVVSHFFERTYDLLGVA